MSPIDWGAKLPQRNTDTIKRLREEGACPIYVRDWYRVPQLFNMAGRLFGPSFMNPKGRHAATLDKTLDFACQVWRTKYMAKCDKRHQEACCHILEKAFTSAAAARPEHPLSYLTACIKSTINSEEIDTALKPLRPKSELPLGSVFQPL